MSQFPSQFYFFSDKRNQVFLCVYAAENVEDHAGENKIAEKQEGGGCEANEERQTLVCFLNSVRMPLLVIRYFFL
uniref:Putative ovule protein n=1 Tax=Solanum chacoense TaxID=4108 RepID=A0A0V0HID5_SOLCH